MSCTENRSRRTPGSPAKVGSLAVLSLIALSSAALAVQVGPGTAQPNIVFDGDGPRTNVTWGSAVNLGAGTFDVVDFAVNTNAANGIVVPFLATYSNVPNDPTFTTVWVGPDLVGDNIAGDHTVNYAPGTQQFTLADPTGIYAGVWHDGISRVGLTLNVGTRT